MGLLLVLLAAIAVFKLCFSLLRLTIEVCIKLTGLVILLGFILICIL